MPPVPSVGGERVVRALGIRIGVTYQPTSRYWAIQGTQTAIYLALALALALAGYCFRQLSRRQS